MSMYEELYVSYQDEIFTTTADIDVTAGKSYTWAFTRPGYFSFDYMCNVPTPSSLQLPDVWFWVKVDGVTRFEARAAWAWNRAFIWVDSGSHAVEFGTTNYSAGQLVTIRNIIVRDYAVVDSFEKIESAVPPKPIENVTSYQILQGYQRYQRTGPRGTEVEFTLIFRNAINWRNFMGKIGGTFIIKGDAGVYSGVILPQDVDTVTQGPLLLTKVKMSSPQTAGVGVDGI